MAKAPIATVIPDSLYALAFTYRKTKLWKLLWDSQLFAVKMADGEIGYCCVMGMNGEHIALAVYVGQDGIDSYRNIANGENYDVYDADGNAEPTFQSHEKMMSQNCIQCSFEHKADMRDLSITLAQDYAKRNGIKLTGVYPDFVSYKPYRFPWYVRDDTDQRYIAQALEAAIEVCRRIEADVAQYQKEIPTFITRDAREVVRSKLGFTDSEPFDKEIPLLEKVDGIFTWSSIALPKEKKKRYPSPKLDTNDILLARIKKAKQYLNAAKHTASWYCDIIMFPHPVSDEADSDDKRNTDGCDLATVGMVAPCDDDKNAVVGCDNNGLAADRSAELDADAELIEAPYFPLAMLAFDSESQVIVSTSIIPKLDTKGYTNLIRTLAETIADKGKPTSFLVKKHDRRTKTVLKTFAEQVGIKIEACDDDDGDLLNAEMDLLGCMSGEDSKISDDGFQKTLDEMTEQLMSISDADLRKMPNDMRDVLLSEAHAGHLDKELSKRLIRVFEGE